MHIFAAAGWATIVSIRVSNACRARSTPGGALSSAAEFLQGRLDHRFDRGQEAGLLVLEVLVEGAAGDARELDQVGDRGRLVALLGDRRDHRREEPLALVALGLLAGRAPARPQLSLPQWKPRRPTEFSPSSDGTYPGIRVVLFSTTRN